MYNPTFFIITGIIVFSYVLSQFLEFLNTKNRNKDIPDELKGIYNEEKYVKSQAYGKANSKLEFLSSTFSVLLTSAMFIFFGFSFINNIALSVSEHTIISALIFLGIILFASDIIDIPFSVNSIFVIEEKFGFNKTTVKTFIGDKFKNLILTAILGGGILSLIIFLYTLNENMFWIWAWIAISIFSVFMSMFYSNLIVPLFNKQKPLEAGELKSAIENFIQKAGFKLDKIFVIDGSKRSTKANAYFSGLGNKKRIVLYDTLINDLSINEILAVLAHETGHYKYKHTLSNMLFSVIQSGIMLYIFSVFVNNPELSKALGSETVRFHLGLIAFGILYSPISMIISLVLNSLSRKHEFRADKFATEQGFGEELISGLKKLTEKDLSNLTPHPFYVLFHYSHPTLLNRIRAINENRN
jgi:STE24 endopeptidase